MNSSMIDSLPDFLGQLGLRILPALLILLLTWLVSRLDSFFLRHLFRAIDRAVDFMRKVDGPLDQQLEQAFTHPLQLLIVTVGSWLAILALELPEIFHWFIYPLANSFITVSIFWALYNLLDIIIYYLDEQEQKYEMVNEVTLRFGKQLATGIIVILALFSILSEWGYDLGAILTGLGLGGLALSLASQDALANLIGYFAIIADTPFILGEYIVVNDKISGTVEQIGFRSTKIRKLDQSLAVVPNQEIASSPITNWSRLSKRRLDMTLRVSRDATPSQILSVVEDISNFLNNYQHTLEDSVTVKFSDFGESSLDILVIAMFDLAGWGEFMQAKEKVQLQVIDILEKHEVKLAVGQTILLEGTENLAASGDNPPN